VFLDDDLKRTITVRDEKHKHTHLTLPVLKDSNVHIRIVFTPDQKCPEHNCPECKCRSSSAEISLRASNVAPFVDKCMTVKDCLQVLGDGSNASFKIRNSNVVQLACLRGQHGSMSEPVKNKCEEWEACLPDEAKQSIATLLGAAIGKSDAKSLTEKAAAQTKEDPNTCIDPSSDDPEAWSCECMESMEEQCSGEDRKKEKEECYREKICGAKKICQSWKEDNCDSESLATLASKRQHALASTSDALDTSLTGKCDG